MQYVLTGSLGHISKPLAEGLLKAGHDVTIITSSADKTSAIEVLGAKAAVGSVDDGEFLTKAFAGADAVYLMIPPSGPSPWRAFQNKVADNYVAAIRANDIRYAVLLSSVGAHMGQGAGPVDGLHDAEERLKAVEGLHVKALRPSYFMYNLFQQVDMVKHAGIMGGNFGDDKLVLVHTDDIAAVALDELARLDFTGFTVRYIAGDERTGQEIAQVLGSAIGRPDVPWIVFSDEDTKQAMVQAGLNEEMAGQYTTMGAALRNGTMQADYFANRPAQFGKIKLDDFARNEFAPAFQG